MKLKLLEFIYNNPEWESILSEKPFSISIKRDGEYILFSYNMIDSDFSNPIVKECRGLILYEPTMTPVCVPFFKFFNVQEGHAAKIDWNTARVLEKIDGSIIKIWYHNYEWHISTNGTIDASKAELGTDIGSIRNYEQLFFSAENVNQELFSRLSIDNTYIFELVSPLNKVVVPYPFTKIFHIGTRNSVTLDELEENIGIEKPKEYFLRSSDECLLAVQEMPFTEEGFVCVDSNYNRVKIKSPQYVLAHHLRNNGVITKSRIVDMIMANGQDDFLSIYSEYAESFGKIEKAISNFAGKVINDMIDIPVNVSRKEYALWAKSTNCPPFFFALLDEWKNIHTPLDWLFLQTNEKILKWIGESDE